MTTGVNQYSQTEITDFYLDLAKFPTASELLDGRQSEYITVEPRHQYRMDLLSYSLYGNSKYWWVIALLNRNQIQDPVRDLKAGMVIRVLAPGDIKRLV
jgi:hypothetical protein